MCLLLFSNGLYAQWFYQVSNTPNKLNKIQFIDSNTGYIVGGDYFIPSQNGVVLKTTNAGTNWISLNYGGTGVLQGMYFLNSLTGFISGESEIKKTTNGGTTWINIPKPVPFEVWGIYFFNELTGFISGSGSKNFYLYKTTNGGINWVQKFYQSGDISSYSQFYFINSNTGFVTKEGLIRKTTNSGENWNLITTLGKDIEFYNENTGTSVAGTFGFSGAIYKTTNQGLNWTTIENQSPGVFNNAIDFIDSTKGFVVCDSGVIKYTSNGGNNWFRQNYPNNLRKTLNDVQFLNEITGYIVGDDGLIMKTTSGGLTFINSNGEIVLGFSLSQNFPNPFNPSTIINYQLTINSFVTLNVYDINGKLIKELVNEKQSAGSHEVNFSGEGLPSGVYYYSLTADGVTIDTKKAILLK
ncbi:MAG: T9SS type A sorting domain-containing protein [Bacteroidetes bacterium]|nr:T9SS type A sorting domain-containing protein [Bacteroidota bacterium]